MPKSPKFRPHTHLRDAFLRKYPLTAFSSGQWLRFNCKVWEQVPEYQIKKEAQALIDGSSLSMSVTSGTVNSVVEMVRTQVSLKDGEFDSNRDLITLTNCTLSIPTRRCLKHTPAHHLTSSFPFDYNSQARSDVWELYLSQVVPSDCLGFLQEFAGYCLTTDTLLETAVWLYGPSGCGKSTFLEGLRAAFGDRVTTFSIANLESRFGLAHLAGKTLAISTEQPGTLKDAQVLNQLISGEGVMVDQKYRDPYEMFCRAKFLWAMNELPIIPKGGIGLQRRIVVIRFPPIPESKQDDAIKRQIIRSGQAIFNWALEGLDRLNARGKFDKPTGSAFVIKLVPDEGFEVEVEETKTCKGCKKKFKTVNLSKQFCTDPCRLKHWRKN